SVTARVVKRYFGLAGSPDEADREAWSVLRSVAGAEPVRVRQLNLALLDLAALICRPVVPLCAECPLSAGCRSAGVAYARGTWRSGGVRQAVGAVGQGPQEKRRGRRAGPASRVVRCA